jgi:hypothetical protein
MAFITVAGENKIAYQQGHDLLFNVTHFVLANIPGLGAEPADRIEAMPSAGNIVDTRAVSRHGYVNANQVVYSLTLDSSIGDYTFNWVGLKDADGVLVAAAHLADPIVKTKTAGGIEGNNLVRNFLLQYSGLAATTAVSTPAETWQIDFTTRLLQIDERERLSNFDIYGQGSFFDNGFKVTFASGTNFTVAAGLGYVGGVRCEKGSNSTISAAGYPKYVYVDASLQGDLTGVSEVIAFTVTASELTDYTDGNGFDHYVTKIAQILATNNIIDLRGHARGSIVLTGDATGSASFDGNRNLSLNVTVVDDSHNHVIGNVDGLLAALEGKEPTIGFTPIQQGGGTGQSNNKLYIGWSAGEELLLQVNTTNFGATWPINISKNAATASKLLTARTISLTGDATGSVSFDGSGNVSMTVTVVDDSHAHVIGNIDGLLAALEGKEPTIGFTPIQQGGGTGQSNNKLYIGWSAGEELLLQVNTTNFGATWPINISKNAATASKLLTARTISLTGDATGSVSFDGSGNVSMTVTVVDDSHAHVIGNIDGLLAALEGKEPTIGFTPIQQGGGTGQNNNKLYIGWSAGEELLLQVNTTNFGATWPINISKNAATASKLQTARTISLTGEASGSVSFDGSGNVSITTTVQQASETVAGKAEIATQAETDAGTDNARFITALKLKNGFAASFVQNGYLKLPSWLGGFMIQWGLANVASEAFATVSFNSAFTSSVFGVIATLKATGPDGGATSSAKTSVINASSFYLVNDQYNSSNAISSYWIAFGI